MYLKNYHIHFVGIGGMGMSGIAKLLIELGYTVSGSDIISSYTTNMLKLLGGIIYIGHKQENIKNAELVVISSAIKPKNIEIEAAVSANIPIIHRSEMLAELMRQKYSIAVSGTHGKTSTTALIANILKNTNFDPTVVAGGILEIIGSNSSVGSGNFIVAEVDESDGSLVKYSPTIAIITNIDKDHLDFYKNMDSMKKVFCDFLNRLPFYGTAILCLDDRITRELIPGIKRKVITYGTNSNADLHASSIDFNGMSSQFTVNYYNEKKGKIILNLPGLHNVYNALSAIVIGLELGIPFSIIQALMKKTKKVKRRMELKGEIDGITIVDDYGHHPTEILVTLDAIDKSWPNKRKIIIFQPHRYTRTEILFNEFASSFHKADILFVLPVYAAGETSIGKLGSENLCIAIRDGGHKNVMYANSFESCVKRLKNVLRKDDLLLTIGAGDVHRIGKSIVDLLN